MVISNGAYKRIMASLERVKKDMEAIKEANHVMPKEEGEARLDVVKASIGTLLKQVHNYKVAMHVMVPDWPGDDVAPQVTAIATEIRDLRAEQAVNGWGGKEIDFWRGKQLATAAAQLIDPDMDNRGEGAPKRWPWHVDMWQPVDYRERLIQGAIMVMAEIERVERAVEKGEWEEPEE